MPKQKKPLSIRTACLLSLVISLLINLFFFIMFIYGNDAVMPSEFPPKETHGIHLSRVAVNFFSIFFFSFILYLINFKLLKVRYKLKYATVITVFIAISSSIILSLLISWLNILFCDSLLDPIRFIRGSITRDLAIGIIILFSSEIISLEQKKKLMAIENETLLSENLRTRYEALKNQIDPHFLFNSLNTLNSLIKIDPDKAQEYVQQFSYVFRYTLQNKDLLPLEEELEFTKAYCTLMQIRYGKNLLFHFQIEDQYKSYAIIPLSIQTLVENAIKHNVVSNKHPLFITVRTIENGYISVSNPIQQKKEPEVSEGIGLANLAERYRLKFQKDIIINISDDTFEVITPLIKL